jgi:glycosyltransferase involved in cell wall biosynthesis
MPGSSKEIAGTRPRKALFVTPVDSYGGAERVLATSARALSASPGWEVEIAVLGAPTGTNFLAGGEASMSFGAGRGGFGSELSLIPRVANRAFDLVFSTHMRLNAALSAARRMGLLKTRRLVARESTVLGDRYAGVRMRAYRSLYGLYGAQDLIMAQTAYMAERLQTLLPARAASRLAIVGNPLDRDAIAGKMREPLEPALARRLAETPHIAWCGRFIGVKNPHRAIATLLEARARTGQDLRLAMMGEGPLRAELETDLARRGLSDLVVFLGNRPNPYPVFAACPLGLLTSDVEGFPNVLLEMMACGVSHVVTTPCAGDLASLQGVVVTKSFEPDVLAAALQQAMLRGGDVRGDYEAALQDRSLGTFLNRMLGETESGQ